MTLLLRNSREHVAGRRLLSKQRNLHHVLADDGEEEIDRNLAHARQLPSARVCGPARRDGDKSRLDLDERLLGPRNDA